jgi:Bacterial PH domain
LTKRTRNHSTTFLPANEVFQIRKSRVIYLPAVLAPVATLLIALVIGLLGHIHTTSILRPGTQNQVQTSVVTTVAAAAQPPADSLVDGLAQPTVNMPSGGGLTQPEPLTLPNQSTPGLHISGLRIYLGLGVFGFLVTLLLWLGAYLSWRTTKATVYTDGLLVETGILLYRSNEIAFRDLQDTNLDSNRILKYWHIGEIRFDTIGSSNITLSWMADIFQSARLVHGLRIDYQRRAAPQPAPPDPRVDSLVAMTAATLAAAERSAAALESMASSALVPPSQPPVPRSP